MEIYDHIFACEAQKALFEILGPRKVGGSGDCCGNQEVFVKYILQGKFPMYIITSSLFGGCVIQEQGARSLFNSMPKVQFILSLVFNRANSIPRRYYGENMPLSWGD